VHFLAQLYLDGQHLGSHTLLDRLAPDDEVAPSRVMSRFANVAGNSALLARMSRVVGLLLLETKDLRALSGWVPPFFRDRPRAGFFCPRCGTGTNRA